MTERPTALSFAKAEATSPPFDSARLDALLDEAGMDARGDLVQAQHPISVRRLPVLFLRSFRRDRRQPLSALLVYVKGRPDQSTYIGHGMEAYEKDLGKFWTPAFQTARASFDSAQLAIDHLRKLAPAGEACRSRARVPACRCGGTHGARAAGRDVRRSAHAARTPARAQDPGRAGFAAPGVRTRGRFDAGGDRLAWARARRKRKSSRRFAAKR